MSNLAAVEYYQRNQIVIPPVVLSEHLWKLTKDHKHKTDDQIEKEKGPGRVICGHDSP